MTALRYRLLCALPVAIAGALLFGFLGNPTHGYIHSDSLFYWWVFQWINPLSESEHGWLILGLSVFALWRNLSLSGTGSESANGRAVVTIAIGLLLHAAGFVAQQPRVSIIGLLFYIWGVLALAGGRRWSAAAAFPLAFMVFAIPVNALDSLGFWLRMWVVTSASGLSHIIGIAVVRSGTELMSANGRYHYDVAAACSGVRSLMALAALSVFVGYLWSERWPLRLALLVLSFPLIFVGNLIRIEGIIVAAQLGGQVWGDRAHEWLGFVVFVFVVAMTALAADLAVRWWPGLLATRATEAPEGPSRLTAGQSAVIASILAAISASFLVYRGHQPVSDRTGVYLAADGVNPVELPSFVGNDWMGKAVEPTAVERSILPPDTGFSRKLYIDLADPSQQVLLSLVLSGRDRSSIHRPELCVVGQGWTITRSSSATFRSPGGPIPATVLEVERETITPRGPQRVLSVITYWFVSSEKVVSSHTSRLLSDTWQRLAHGQADRWAYVLLQTNGGQGLDPALGRIQTVLDGTLPEFEKVPVSRK